MTRDDVIRMAREAGVKDGLLSWPGVPEMFERFAALVAAAEREECAKVAEKTICDTHIPTNINIYGTRAGKAIRARGKTK